MEWPSPGANGTMAQRVRFFGPMSHALSPLIGGLICHIWRDEKEMSLGAFMMLLYPMLSTLFPLFAERCDDILNLICCIFSTVFDRKAAAETTAPEQPVEEPIAKKLSGIMKRNDIKSIQEFNNDTIGPSRSTQLLPDGRIVVENHRVTRNANDILADWWAKGYRVWIIEKVDTSWTEYQNITREVHKFESNFPESFFYRYQHYPTIQSGHVELMCFTVAFEEEGKRKFSFSGGIAVSPDFQQADLSMQLFGTSYWMSDLYSLVFPPKQSKYLLNKVYNTHSEEIKETVSRYQAFQQGATTARRICSNFCFAGPTGTCKTYAARAIASFLNRTLVEINLKKFVYEDDFYEFIETTPTDKSVFLLDEIDLMCPDREFDDAVLTIDRKKRLSTLSMTTESTDGNDDFQDGEATKNSLAAMEKSIKKIESDVTLHNLRFTVSQAMRSPNSNDVCHRMVGMSYADTKNALDAAELGNVVTKGGATATGIAKEPLTLRTLLTWLSGPNTPDSLVVIATTNRPEKLAPELVRPGRLRLMRFDNLRKVDLCDLLSEIFPRDKVEILIEKIGYQDHSLSGATVEAIMSSCINMSQLENALCRELALALV